MASCYGPAKATTPICSGHCEAAAAISASSPRSSSACMRSAPIFFPFERARDVLAKFRDFVAGMPDQLSVWAVLRKAPPLPFLPANVHGREILVLALLYAGDPA